MGSFVDSDGAKLPPADDRSDFWMLYAEGGGAPTTKHHEFRAAQAEAERIVGSNRNVARVYVLHADAVVERDAPPITVTMLPNARAVSDAE